MAPMEFVVSTQQPAATGPARKACPTVGDWWHSTKSECDQMFRRDSVQSLGDWWQSRHRSSAGKEQDADVRFEISQCVEAGPVLRMKARPSVGDWWHNTKSECDQMKPHEGLGRHSVQSLGAWYHTRDVSSVGKEQVADFGSDFSKSTEAESGGDADSDVDSEGGAWEDLSIDSDGDMDSALTCNEEDTVPEATPDEPETWLGLLLLAWQQQQAFRPDC